MMKKNLLITVLVLIFVLMVDVSASAQSSDEVKVKNETEKSVIRRFALVVGANDGGPHRAKLRYAVSDAKAVLKVLEEMGGVLADDSRLLVEPTREAFFWEMKRLQDRVNRARAEHRRVEVIFYYSGHSDEKNILVGKEKISYQDFRDEINRMEADVRIAILDSCASGAFTQLKGGKKRAPFLVDTAYDMKGYAVMTSSSSDEASQESDRLEGSYFTHYLISGLRGAADMTQDGRVTLNEAYQFSFNETLAQTEQTVSGPQHPNYNIQMSGTGDVVMTDIRHSSTILVLGKDVSGKIFIHDPKDVLVVELNKPSGRDIELGLEKGKYRVIVIAEGLIWESKVKLPEGKRVALARDDFKKMDKIDTVARGDFRAIKRKTFKKRGKTTIFGAWLNKLTRVRDTWSMLSGFQFGLTFNRSLSIGFAGFANTGDFPLGHPVYWGLTVEYLFPARSMFQPKVGILVGAGEEYLLSHGFYVIEPEASVTFNITRKFSITSGISFRINTRENAVLSPFSWGFSLELGR
ncbi:MAG: hypothetical protein GTO45_36835 [Candidatus Aminicenantes bacterium]|nr:hypothetical protein [Candidatus Aminicenantes bacterium]NIM78213.1 hypothetical protein [Candidatus Aminicenantes bacterium]NIN23719.1 hypothetical protein [Candidatus Aminicenantes bacterium]NIN47426.1 hypothetical protein [Candidatus Aminicenantes bacterium]NIN90354.1 hypothetical protein [Candidatus Aminicenantes bacterium]